MEPKYKLLISNTTIFMIGNVLVKFISFILMPLYTSVLTTSQYGTAELINSTIEIVLPLATLCMCDALFRFSIDKDVDHETLLVNTIVVVVIGIILMGTMCLIIHFVFRYEYIIHFFFLFFATTFYKVTTQFARGLGHVKRYVIYSVTNVVVLIIFNIVLLVFLKGEIGAYLISFILGYGIAGCVAFIASREYSYWNINKYDSRQLKAMLKYSLPNIPNKLSWWVNHLSDRYIMLWFLGSGVTGLYTAASKLPAMINLIDSIFHQAWQYSTSTEIDSEDSNTFFTNVFRAYTYFCIITCTILVICNRPICKILLQSEFYISWRFVPLLLLAATFGCISSFFGTFCNALKNNMLLMWSTVIGAIINIVLNVILIPIFGGMGAAIATVVSYFIIMVIRIYKIKKYISIHISTIRLITQILFLGLSVVFGCFDGIKYLLACCICLLILILSDWRIIKKGLMLILGKHK